MSTRMSREDEEMAYYGDSSEDEDAGEDGYHNGDTKKKGKGWDFLLDCVRKLKVSKKVSKEVTKVTNDTRDRSDAIPRSNSTDRSDTIPRSNSTDRGDAIPRSNSTDRSDAIPRLNSTDRSDAIPRSNGKDRSNAIPRSSRKRRSKDVNETNTTMNSDDAKTPKKSKRDHYDDCDAVDVKVDQACLPCKDRKAKCCFKRPCCRCRDRKTEHRCKNGPQKKAGRPPKHAFRPHKTPRLPTSKKKTYVPRPEPVVAPRTHHTRGNHKKLAMSPPTSMEFLLPTSMKSSIIQHPVQSLNHSGIPPAPTTAPPQTAPPRERRLPFQSIPDAITPSSSKHFLFRASKQVTLSFAHNMKKIAPHPQPPPPPPQLPQQSDAPPPPPPQSSYKQQIGFQMNQTYHFAPNDEMTRIRR